MTPWQAMPWPQRAKYSAKWLVASLLYATGVLQWRLRRVLRGRTLVLMYHRVLTPQQADRCWSHRAIIVERATFARQMAAVRRYFDVVSLDRFEANLGSASGALRPACLVTFDDGWLDTYREAWPVLREYEIPAVVFLPVAFIGSGQRFWQERMAAMLFELWQACRVDPELRARATPVLASLDFAALLSAPAAVVRQLTMELVQQQKRVDSTAADATIARLQDLLRGGETDADDFMNWTQVREMAATGISFGAHGVTHRILTTLPLAAVREEAEASRDAIVRELGRVTAFSYPNGGWNADVAAVVRDAAFHLGFSTDPGSVAHGDDRMTLRRVNIHEDVTRSVPLFLARLSGVL